MIDTERNKIYLGYSLEVFLDLAESNLDETVFISSQGGFESCSLVDEEYLQRIEEKGEKKSLNTFKQVRKYCSPYPLVLNIGKKDIILGRSRERNHLELERLGFTFNTNEESKVTRKYKQELNILKNLFFDYTDPDYKQTSLKRALTSQYYVIDNKMFYPDIIAELETRNLTFINGSIVDFDLVKKTVDYILLDSLEGMLGSKEIYYHKIGDILCFGEGREKIEQDFLKKTSFLIEGLPSDFIHLSVPQYLEEGVYTPLMVFVPYRKQTYAFCLSSYRWSMKNTKFREIVRRQMLHYLLQRFDISENDFQIHPQSQAAENSFLPMKRSRPGPCQFKNFHYLH
ncbi:MAG: hypothetical protein H6621_11740 [Halobacteriovoraceae bacterium]|nr:hypothetical protein [Halobacteriovoraceae bacterium]MCB9095732.1 hypothetical protein [Halobacteriovoraceae bacterium]